jgi:hypothetical protein
MATNVGSENSACRPVGAPSRIGPLRLWNCLFRKYMKAMRVISSEPAPNTKKLSDERHGAEDEDQLR